QTSELFRELREPQSAGACASCDFYDSCRGGCMAAKFFTGLPMDGPDPECARGLGEGLLAAERNIPAPSQDHTRPRSRAARNQPTVQVPLTLVPAPPRRPTGQCDESPI